MKHLDELARIDSQPTKGSFNLHRDGGADMGMGQVAKAIWAGPFSVGPLVQPITLGAALLKILEVLWKGVVSLIIAAVALVGTVIGWDSLDHRLHPSFESQLASEAHFAPQACTSDHPIMVIIRNGSKQPLKSAELELVVTEPGRSTNLDSEPTLNWDAIVEPGAFAGLCYGLPAGITAAPATLNYRTEIWLATPQPESERLKPASSSSPSMIGKALSKIGQLAVVLPFIAILALGGFGLFTLCNVAVRGRLGTPSFGMIWLVGFLNFMIVGLAGWPAHDWTFLGGWYDAVDNWSRARGWSDLGALAFYMPFLLWPWLIVYGLRQIGIGHNMPGRISEDASSI